MQHCSHIRTPLLSPSCPPPSRNRQHQPASQSRQTRTPARPHAYIQAWVVAPAPLILPWLVSQPAAGRPSWAGSLCPKYYPRNKMNDLPVVGVRVHVHTRSPDAHILRLAVASSSVASSERAGTAKQAEPPRPPRLEGVCICYRCPCFAELVRRRLA